ncbi:hypothetical protein IAT38_007286 [Cryptococcus sp. DSM 104549]
MEVPHPEWARRTAGVEAVISGRRVTAPTNAPRSILALAKREVAVVCQRMGQRNDPILSVQLGVVIRHYFVLGHISYQMNQELRPSPIDLSRVPTREEALKWEEERAVRKEEDTVIVLTKLGPPMLFCLWAGMALGDSVASSTKKIDDLKIVDFEDMSVPNRHLGRMIVGRVVSGRGKGLGQRFHLEEPSGNVLPVEFVHSNLIPWHELERLNELSDKTLIVGTIVAIKEPVSRYGRGGGYLLVVDIPTDVVELPPSSPLLNGISWKLPPLIMDPPNLSWETYKALGNQEITSLPTIAIMRYTTALQDAEVLNDPHKRFILLLNRSKAYINVRLYAPAYCDALKARKLADNYSLPITTTQRTRIVWRMATAAYGLRLWNKAGELAEECKGSPELGEPLFSMIARIEGRKVERDTGRYAYQEVLELAHAGPSPLIPLADYTEPIELREKADGTCGLFVTRDVKRGELLMATKTLVTCWEGEIYNTALSAFDCKTQKTIPHRFYYMLEFLIGKVQGDPALARVLNALPTKDNPRPANLADVRPMSESEYLRYLESESPYAVDREKIYAVLEKNCLDMPLPPLCQDADKSFHKRGGIVPGLFALPMAAKQVCLGGNFTRELGCDTLFSRAIFDLPKGTELLFATPHAQLAKRAADLPTSSLLSTCDCVLCEADKKDGWRTRAAVAAEYERGGIPADKKLETLRQIAARLEATYAGDREDWMKPELGLVWNSIWALLRAAQRDRSGAGDVEQRLAEAQENTLRYFGAIPATPEQRKKHGRIIDRIVYPSPVLGETGSLYMALLQHSMDSPKDHSAWERTLYWMHHLYCGGDLEFYKWRFKQLLEQKSTVNWDGLQEEENW